MFCLEMGLVPTICPCPGYHLGMCRLIVRHPFPLFCRLPARDLAFRRGASPQQPLLLDLHKIGTSTDFLCGNAGLLTPTTGAAGQCPLARGQFTPTDPSRLSMWPEQEALFPEQLCPNQSPFGPQQQHP